MKQNTNPVQAINLLLTVSVLEQATALAKEIETKQAQLHALLSGQPQAVPAAPAVKTTKGAKGGRFTPAQRAAISAGLKAKWALRKAAKAAGASTPAPATTEAPSSLTSGEIPAGAEAVTLLTPEQARARQAAAA